MSKRALKKARIFGCLVLAVGMAMSWVRVAKHYKMAELNPAELRTKQQKGPIPEDCLDADLVLARLREPTKVINKLPPENKGAPSPDEIAIYKAVLQEYAFGDRVRHRTSPRDSDV